MANRTAATIWNGSITMITSMTMASHRRQNPARGNSIAESVRKVSVSNDRSDRAELRLRMEKRGRRKGAGLMGTQISILVGVVTFYKRNHKRAALRPSIGRA